MWKISCFSRKEQPSGASVLRSCRPKMPSPWIWRPELFFFFYLIFSKESGNLWAGGPSWKNWGSYSESSRIAPIVFFHRFDQGWVHAIHPSQKGHKPLNQGVGIGCKWLGMEFNIFLWRIVCCYISTSFVYLLDIKQLYFHPTSINKSNQSKRLELHASQVYLPFSLQKIDRVTFGIMSSEQAAYFVMLEVITFWSFWWLKR